jgi:hypothetical protein
MAGLLTDGRDKGVGWQFTPPVSKMNTTTLFLIKNEYNVWTGEWAEQKGRRSSYGVASHGWAGRENAESNFIWLNV